MRIEGLRRAKAQRPVQNPNGAKSNLESRKLRMR